MDASLGEIIGIRGDFTASNGGPSKLLRWERGWSGQECRGASCARRGKKRTAITWSIVAEDEEVRAGAEGVRTCRS